MEGIVIDAKVFSRRGVDKDDRTRLIEARGNRPLEKNRDDELRFIEELAREQIEKLLVGRKMCGIPQKGAKRYLVTKDEPH